MIKRLKNYLLKKKLNLSNDKVKICEKGYFEFPEKIKFCGYAYVGPKAYWSAAGGISIGNNVIFGPCTSIWTSSHNYKTTTAIPYGPKEEDILGPVQIKDNVWVGMNALILKGVTIEEGAIIGAGAVVTKDIPYLAIVVGNPAKIIGYRCKDEYLLMKRKGLHYLELKAKRLL